MNLVQTIDELDTESIMSYCAENEVGYIAMAWRSANGNFSGCDIASDWEGKELTEWGKYVFYADAIGILDTAVGPYLIDTPDNCMFPLTIEDDQLTVDGMQDVMLRGASVLHAWYRDYTDVSIKALMRLDVNAVKVEISDGECYTETTVEELEEIIEICSDKDSCKRLDGFLAAGRRVGKCLP